MAIDSLAPILSGFVALSASVAALAGIVVLQAFFHDKLKNLFDDANYFIFFFLVAGYVLYALGEVSFYLTSVVFQDTGLIGIHDLYWPSGAFLILASFVALATVLFKAQPHSGKLGTMLITGSILVAFVAAIVFGLVGAQSQYFFGYIFPIMSALIVSAALSVILFFREVGGFRHVLLIFFFASCAILVGDIFFHYHNAWGGYGAVGFIIDISYLAGYILSLFGFITMRLQMHSLAFRK